MLLIIHKTNELDKVEAWGVYSDGRVVNLTEQESIDNWIREHYKTLNVKSFVSYNMDDVSKRNDDLESARNLAHLDRFMG